MINLSKRKIALFQKLFEEKAAAEKARRETIKVSGAQDSNPAPAAPEPRVVPTQLDVTSSYEAPKVTVTTEEAKPKAKKPPKVKEETQFDLEEAFPSLPTSAPAGMSFFASSPSKFVKNLSNGSTSSGGETNNEKILNSLTDNLKKDMKLSERTNPDL